MMTEQQQQQHKDGLGGEDVVVVWVQCVTYWGISAGERSRVCVCVCLGKQSVSYSIDERR